MKSWLFLFSLVLPFFIYIFSWTEGLQCYECVYIDSDEIPEDLKDKMEPSCKKGRTPSRHLLRECPFGHICGKLHANHSKPILGNAEVSGRACVEKVDRFFNTCVGDASPAELMRYPSFNFWLYYVLSSELSTVCTSDVNDGGCSSTCLCSCSC